jgi:hypothetical protein
MLRGCLARLHPTAQTHAKHELFSSGTLIFAFFAPLREGILAGDLQREIFNQSRPHAEKQVNA